MIKRTILVIAALGLLLAPLQAGDRRMSIEDSLSIRQVGGIQWSADGQSVFFTIRDWNQEKNRYFTHAYKIAVSGGDPVQLTRGERGESQPKPSPDGKYLAFLANRGSPDRSESREQGAEQRGVNQVWLLPLAGGESFQLTKQDNSVSGFAWSPDSRRIAYATLDSFPDKKEREERKKDKFDAVVVDRDFRWTHLYVIGLDGEEKERLSEGEFNASNPQFSLDGQQIVFQASFTPNQPSPWKHSDDNRQSDLYLVSAQGGQAENLTPGPGRASSPRWSPDGKMLSYSSSPRQDNAAKSDLMVMEVASKQARNLSEENPESIQGGAVWSSDGQSLYYGQGKGLYTLLNSIPAAGGTARTLLDEPGIGRGGVEVSPDGQSLAYIANDPTRPGDIWLSRSDGSGAKRLTDVNPQITDFAAAETRPIRWKTPDGWEIEGILVLPVDYQPGRRYPLILQIHGGPTGRFTHSYNSRNVQVWAGRGFALLQPNPRGSTGYGHSFSQANQSDWGGKDFHYDDMSGVDKVIEMGIADPDRMVVMGGSYGGFSTFWAITQTDRFKAAIGHAAISDWYSFYGQTDIPQYLKWGFEGHAWDNAETFRKFSPFEYVKNVKTPLMITHGENDMRVPIAQAEQYYTALKKLGVEVEFVRYPREGHGIREPNHVLDLAGRQQEWFDRHLEIQRKDATEAPVDPR
ncbi:MAG: S9 family peptidase [Acidobacteriota bacterium]